MCSSFLIPCHATHGRARAGWHCQWDDEEYDDEGEIIEYEYLDYVFVGKDFQKDGEDIRWPAMYSISLCMCTAYRCCSDPGRCTPMSCPNPNTRAAVLL